MGLLQARILEWVAISPSRESSTQDGTSVSCISSIAGRFFVAESTGKPLLNSQKWSYPNGLDMSKTVSIREYHGFTHLRGSYRAKFPAALGKFTF